MRLAASLISRRFSRLIVVSRTNITRHSDRFWVCRCDCGQETTVSGNRLRQGRTTSCGCFRRERARTHGLSKTREYSLWHHAKRRAKKANVEFSISVSDVAIPKHCPVLGIAITQNGRTGDGSPTIDRINPIMGYRLDNIMVISSRANRIKNNASIEELKMVISYMQSHAEKGITGWESSRRLALVV